MARLREGVKGRKVLARGVSSRANLVVATAPKEWKSSVQQWL